MTVVEVRKIKASTREINALDRYRRGRKVLLDDLAEKYGKSQGYLSKALAGLIPLTREEVKAIRQAIQELSR